MATRLPEGEFDERLESVRERIEASDADAGVWFDEHRVSGRLRAHPDRASRRPRAHPRTL
jgi:hypothetical protein